MKGYQLSDANFIQLIERDCTKTPPENYLFILYKHTLLCPRNSAVCLCWSCETHAFDYPGNHLLVNVLVQICLY